MAPFTIQSPAMLALLVGLLPLAWLMQRAARERQHVRASLHAANAATTGRRDFLRLSALALMLFALARPGYAPERQSTSVAGRDVVFVLDVSRSMLAEDVSPSRLEAAKQAVRDCLDTFERERAGLVIYAGSASIACPLTRDYQFVRYMLDQAQPRAVEFGGTFLLSAVEKTIDQIFEARRDGFQDMIVLTDGGDHGADMDRVAATLATRGVELLVIGLGDATQGARIPVIDAEGTTTYLAHDGQVVRTMLEERILRSLTSQISGARYHGSGTAPFHLGDLYRDFSKGKAAEGELGENEFIDYRDGAFVLLPIALLLLLLPEWKGRGLLTTATATTTACLLALSPNLHAESTSERLFHEATASLSRGDGGEAHALFSSLRTQNELSPEHAAAVSFNQGLSLILQIDPATPAVQRLELAQASQLAFLAAAREQPGYQRASQQLDAVAGLIDELREEIAAEAASENQLDEELDALVERLQQLLENQLELLRSTTEGAPPDLLADAIEQAATAFAAQQTLRKETLSITAKMKTIADNLAVPESENFLAEPLRLIVEVATSQESAAQSLRQRPTWPSARPPQQQAADYIDEILALLSDNSSDNSDDNGDESEIMDEEEFESWEDSEAEKSQASSLPMDGDFSSSALTQALPIPNLSVDDILQEEAGNQQFRQQKRAESNAQKVENDW